MIKTLGSVLTCVVAKFPKWCYPVWNLSQDVEGAIAKLGANVTAARLFSKLCLLEPIGIDRKGAGHGMRCGAGELVR